MNAQESYVRIAEPSRVVGLEVERNELGLSVVLRLAAVDVPRTYVLRFRQVQELRLRSHYTELQGIVLMLAEDISRSGLEGMRWRVKDYEEEFLSFVCAEIEK